MRIPPGLLVAGDPYARTQSDGTVTVLAEGVQALEEDREIFIFEKRNGAWKIARHIFNRTS